MICFRCGKYGHRTISCLTNNEDAEAAQEHDTSSTRSRPEINRRLKEEECRSTFVPWMLAQRTKRRPAKQTPIGYKEHPKVMDDVSGRVGLSGSRFCLLESSPQYPKAVEGRTGRLEKHPHHTESVDEHADLEAAHRTQFAQGNSEGTHDDMRPKDLINGGCIHGGITSRRPLPG